MMIGLPYPTGPVPEARDAHRWDAPACAALVLVPVACDLARPGVNASILFLLPLVLFALTAHTRQTVRRATALLVVLTYACYAAKAANLGIGWWTYRLFNRTLVAAMLVVAGVLLDQLLAHVQARRWLRAEATDADQPVYDAILSGSQRLVVGIAAATLGLVLFAVDLVVPGQYNVTILFAGPLLLAVWTRSRAWTWGLAVLFVALTFVSWVIGRPPTVPADVFPRLLANRSIACAVLLVVALLLHCRTAPATPVRA